MARKSAAEAKAERTTWFFLVLVFIILSFDREDTIPDFAVPIVTAVILFVSAFIQLRRGWRVAPIVWIIATILALVGGLTYYFETQVTPNEAIDIVLTYLNPVLISLAATVLVILLGVLTNES